MGGTSRIEDDRQAGASQLARRAIEMMAQQAGSFSDLEQVHGEAARIGSLRPSMAAIEGALRIYVSILEDLLGEGMDLARAGRESGRRAIGQLDEIRRRVVATALEILDDTPHDRIVTVSCSSTVMAVLDERSPPALLVGEGRPGMEGRTLARRYADGGVDVQLCVDAALAGHMRSGDLVLVGADSVQADGALVNKIGSLAMALRARNLGVPFLAACETFKFSARDEIPLEGKEASEVWPDAPSSVAVSNFYFEMVPASLVTAFVTDRGLVRYGDDGWPEA